MLPLNTEATSGPSGAPSSPSSTEDAVPSQVSQGDANDVEYENTSDTTASGYDSFSDSDSEDDEAVMTEGERKLEREMRVAERQLVLEAAGIVVKKDTTRRPPPHLQRRRAVTSVPPKHRPAPAPPAETSSVPTSSLGLDPSELPPPVPAKEYLDDAYERYEAFKQHASRSSISSIDQLPPLSPVSPNVGSLSLAPAQSRESVPDKEKGKDNVSTSPSYGSRISQFLARSRTPGQERESRIMPTISAPMMSATSSDTGTLGPPAREGSPGFGSVCDVLTLPRGSTSLTIYHGVVGKPRRQVCAGGPAGS